MNRPGSSPIAGSIETGAGIEPWICDDHLWVITACMPDDEYWIDVRTGRKK
ncbi:MAG: hypothetical protein GX882_05340 [Methanomicrobiales archaeon]|nr:hypothetical protein [Methanomicrobiales archaeon]